jgi:hypothetical protein
MKDGSPAATRCWNEQVNRGGERDQARSHLASNDSQRKVSSVLTSEAPFVMSISSIWRNFRFKKLDQCFYLWRLHKSLRVNEQFYLLLATDRAQVTGEPVLGQIFVRYPRACRQGWRL